MYSIVNEICLSAHFTSVTISRSIPVAADGIICPFLWLSNVPLCTTSISVPLVDGHFSCSCLSVVNSASVSIRVCILF